MAVLVVRIQALKRRNNDKLEQDGVIGGTGDSDARLAAAIRVSGK